METSLKKVCMIGLTCHFTYGPCFSFTERGSYEIVRREVFARVKWQLTRINTEFPVNILKDLAIDILILTRN